MTNQEFIESISLPNEEWRDVIGYEGYYMVSSFGRILSLPRIINNHTGYRVSKHRILSPRLNSGGYYQVAFCINKTLKQPHIHKLVAEAFIPNPNNYPQVDHIDCNKRNNTVANLKWCTQSMNMNNPITKEYIDSKRLEFCREEWYIETQRYSQPHSKCVLQYSLNGDLIARWRTISEAARSIGASVQAISRCCNGVVKTSMNYIWKFE
jgi:hypothetical protein